MPDEQLQLDRIAEAVLPPCGDLQAPAQAPESIDLGSRLGLIVDEVEKIRNVLTLPSPSIRERFEPAHESSESLRRRMNGNVSRAGITAQEYAEISEKLKTETIPQITAQSITTPEGASRMNRIVSELVEQISFMRARAEEAQILREENEATYPIYRQKVIQEKGYQDSDEMRNRMEDIVKELSALRHPFHESARQPFNILKNIGAQFNNRHEIKGLEDEYKKLMETFEAIGTSSFAIDRVSVLSDNYQVSEALNAIVSVIHKALEGLEGDLATRVGEEVSSEEVLRHVRHQFATDYFYASIKKSYILRELTPPLDKEDPALESHPQIIEASAIIEKMFGRPIQTNYIVTDEVLVQDQNEAKERLGALPRSLAEHAISITSQSLQISKALSFFSQLGTDPDSVRQYQLMLDGLSKLRKTVDEIAHAEISLGQGYSISPPHKMYNLETAYKKCCTLCAEAQGAKVVEDTSIISWHMVKSALLDLEISTPAQLKKADDVLSATIARQIATTSSDRDNVNARIQLGINLYHFTTPEIVPLAILNAWVENGTSGEMPLRSVQMQGCAGWLVSDYLKNLPEETLIVLDQHGLTGVRDLKMLVLNDPNNWGREELYIPQAEYPYPPNPGYEKTYQAMEQIIIHVLKNGSVEEKCHAAKAFGRVKGNTTEKGRSELLQILNHETDASVRHVLQDAMLDKGVEYGGDMGLLRQLLSKMTEAGESSLKSPKMSASIFEAFTRIEPTDDDYLKLSILSGHSIEDLKVTREFVLNCRNDEGAGHVNMNYSVSSEESTAATYLGTWVRYAKDSRIPEIIKALNEGKCYATFSDLPALLDGYVNYPELPAMLRSTVPRLREYWYHFTMRDLMPLCSIHDEGEAFFTKLASVRKEVPDYRYYIRSNQIDGNSVYTTDPYKCAAASVAGNLWHEVGKLSNLTPPRSEAYMHALYELVAADYKTEDLEHVERQIRTFGKAINEHPELVSFCQINGVSRMIFSGGSTVEPGLILDYAPWLAEQMAGVKANKQFSFIAVDKVLPVFFSLPRAELEKIKESKYESAFIFGVLGPLIAQRQVDVSALCRTFPRSAAILNDRYQLEYMASFIAEKPSEQASVLAAVINKGLSAQNGEGGKLIEIMSFVHAIDNPEYAERLLPALEDPAVTSLSQFHTHAVSALIDLLSDRYPRNLLEKLPPAELSHFVLVYSTYEKTLIHFHSSASIPAMRFIALSELLGKEAELRNDDPEYFADFQKNIEEYVLLESERPAVLSYIANRLVDTAPRIEWRKSDAGSEYVIGEVSVEDRIQSVFNVLRTLMEASHLSEALRETEMIQPGVNPLKELAEQWRKAGTPEEKAKIESQQRRLTQWSPLRTIISNYEEKCSDFLSRYQALRDEKLLPYAQCIEALGFAFHDSFGRKVFRGEMKLLADAALAQQLDTQTKFKYKDQLAGLIKVLKEGETLNQRAEDYLNNLYTQIGKVHALLIERKEAISGLAKELPGTHSPDEHCSFISQRTPELGDYLTRKLSVIPEPGDKVTFIEETLQAAQESTAIQDFEHLSNMAKESASKETIWKYNREICFSRMLASMVGQCLDYRSSKNSIGNSVYNIALTDRNRSVIVARDESGAPRLNVICYAANVTFDDGSSHTSLVLDIPYVSDGSSMSADKSRGLVVYAHALAASRGMPLVVPKRSIQKEIVNDAALELQVSATEQNGVVTILPGPSGAAYVEIESFTHYDEPTEIPSEMAVLWPYNIH